MERMEWGLPVINGKVRCRVLRRFDGRQARCLHSFTPSAIRAELAKGPARRFEPDVADDTKGSLLGIAGMTSTDQEMLHNLGVYGPADIAHDPPSESASVALSAWYASDPAEMQRRRKLIRAYVERVAQVGVESAQGAQPVVDALGLNDALAKLADGETLSADEAQYLVAGLPDADHDALADPLAAAYVWLKGQPVGKRKPKTLALAIVAELAG